MNTQHIGLLLHPALSQEVIDPSQKLYYVSWSFSRLQTSRYISKRLAYIDSDPRNLHFRGKPIVAAWHDIYIVAYPPSITGRAAIPYLSRVSLPDITLTSFRIPRALLQTLAALELFPYTSTVFRDPVSKDGIRFTCQNVALTEFIYILFRTCEQASTDSHVHHWAWAEHFHRATWNHPITERMHDCVTDHIEDWPDGTSRQT